MAHPVGRAKPSSVAVATLLGLLPFAQWNWGCGVWTKKMGRKMRKIGALGQKPKKAKKKVKKNPASDCLVPMHVCRAPWTAAVCSATSTVEVMVAQALVPHVRWAS